MLAPVILFVYNRFDHITKTLKAISENYLAKETDLIIFSDGPKKEKDVEAVTKVRSIINNEDYKKMFKTVTIVESDANKGLAKSIIEGVSQIIEKTGKVIVLEDDCVSSKDFLNYMNSALDYYEENDKVWSIGGYSVNLDFPNDYEYDTYVMGRTCSYAWGTWKNRWNLVDWNVSDYNKFKYSLKKRRKFNRYGEDRSKMLDMQQVGKTNSWAIRFCYAMFKNNMYTIYPCQSKIKNIGYDVGTHTMKRGSFSVETSEKEISCFTDNIEVNETLRKQYIKYFKTNKLKLFASFVLNVLLKPKRGKK